MQSPSDGVAPQLLHYVHLLSTHPYPRLNPLSDDQVLEFLLQAPRVVRDISPMIWQMITPPPDSSMFLTWQSPKLGKTMASDGYIWADVESTFLIEARGFQIEVLVHRSGFRPNAESIACHQRKRYHIISKLPSNPQEIDSNLWITHYSPAEPQFRYQVNQLPVKPEHHAMLRDRQYLQERGQLVRKDFMLHDRVNWPQIPFPGGPQQMMQPGMPMQQPPTPGFPPGHPQYGQAPQQMRGYYPPAQQMQQQTPGPQAKKQRINPPPRVPSGAAPPLPTVAEIALEDEENTAFGDYLDHITPREISTMRYKQHHEWMEEIFSSIYAGSQILPDDLGLGLAGDLADLTAGILDAPEVFDSSQDGANALSAIAKPYQRLDTAQRDELDKRIQKFTEDGHAELRAMKAAHAKKLADLHNTHRTYTLAERALRNGSSPTGTDAIDKTVQDVEKQLNLNFGARQDVVCLQADGVHNSPLERDDSNWLDALQKKYESRAKAAADPASRAPAAAPTAMNGNGAYDGNSNSNSNGYSNGHDMHEDSASALLNQYVTGGSSAGTPGSFSALQNRSLPQSNAGTPLSFGNMGTPTTQAPAGQAPVSGAATQASSLPGTVSQTQTLPGAAEQSDGMDLDMDTSQSQTQTVPAPAAISTVSSTAAVATPASAAPLPSTDQQEAVSSAKPDVPAVPGITPPEVQDPTSMLNDDINIDMEEPSSMFDTTDLSAFDSAGDALADLGGGDDIDIATGMVTGGDGDDFGLDLDVGGGDVGDDAFGAVLDTTGDQGPAAPMETETETQVVAGDGGAEQDAFAGLPGL